MAHQFRFFAQPEDQQEGTFSEETYWSVVGDEHHHLTKVLRLSVGAKVELITGQGEVAKGEVAQVHNRQTLVKVESLVKEAPRNLKLICCLGALKGSSLDDLLPSLVELGVDEFHIFLSAGDGKYLISEKAQKRWQSKVSGATKQSKRAYRPTLEVWSSLEKLVEAFSSKKIAKVLLSAPGETSEPSGQLADDSFVKDTCLLVGSEKGLTSREQKLCEDGGFQRKTIGSHVLRSVTASLASVAILSSLRGIN